LRKRTVIEKKIGFEIRDLNKLKRLSKYYIWSLRLRAILRKEGHRSYSKSVITIASFSILIKRVNLIEAIFKKKKSFACKIIILSIADDRVDKITHYTKKL
jgi:hypothetical protein